MLLLLLLFFLLLLHRIARFCLLEKRQETATFVTGLEDIHGKLLRTGLGFCVPVDGAKCRHLFAGSGGLANPHDNFPPGVQQIDAVVLEGLPSHEIQHGNLGGLLYELPETDLLEGHGRVGIDRKEFGFEIGEGFCQVLALFPAGRGFSDGSAAPAAATARDVVSTSLEVGPEFFVLVVVFTLRQYSHGSLGAEFFGLADTARLLENPDLTICFFGFKIVGIADLQLMRCLFGQRGSKK